MLAPLEEVPGGDQADERALRVHEGQLLDLVRPHHLLGGVRVNGAFPHRQPVSQRHPRRHRRRGVCLREPQVARGEQAADTSRLVDHDQRANARGSHPLRGLCQRRLRPDRVLVGDDAVLPTFDDLHLAHLGRDFAGAESAVDDPDPPFLRDGDSHLGSGHRVHVGGHDRALQREVFRKRRGQVERGRVASLDHAVVRDQQKVVERGASDKVRPGRSHRISIARPASG